MEDKRNAVQFLKDGIENREKRTVLEFEEFLALTTREPQRVLRSIFQLFSDMIKFYVGEGEDEYPHDPESIGFVKYDCARIFSENSEDPFFPDRLFANRFVRQAESLKRGAQQNRMNVYEGPPGCGKSVFLNNLLRTIENYTYTKEGRNFEIFWRIESDKETLSVPCPSHDHPILLIPKNYREEFLKKLIPDKAAEFKNRLFNAKEYEWIFVEEVCTICKSFFWALFDKEGSLEKVLRLAKVRTYLFDRRLGEGISVFNPGDKPAKDYVLTDRYIQRKLDQFFGAQLVKYVFSGLAKTNNGIYVLMDIKSHNKERLLELHNVISEGVHKVGDIEERVNSLFLALMNPEDKESIKEEKAESFQSRIQYNKIRYVLEVPTEVAIYRSVYGDHISSRFLPRVLENFVRVIISSRMETKCEPLQTWIPHMAKYKKYCDEEGLLLRMEIYSGVIPPWLSEEDRKKFTTDVRRRLIAEGENEGERGFSGRESITLFGDLFSRYADKPVLINMKNVTDFFKHKIGRERRDKYVPKNFTVALVNWYHYVVLNEVKESLYFYNQDQINEDILHYLCAVNYDIGSKLVCAFTGKEIEVTVDFLRIIGSYLTGREMRDQDALEYAMEVQKKYTKILAQREKEITDSELYQELFGAYVRNLKEKALHPFLKNKSFREAVRMFGDKSFDSFDSRLKAHVEYMIKNLIEKFGYTRQGAKEICLYVLDQKLAEEFS